ncbi:fimbrillin family protein [Hoylesella enoeca]|uniref:fimbrillin family protein n=1 Tax=Hoylesella enoeca TaxID=76123 RepID=UPI00288C42E6|nr:fimbrillin family protein [Hoylesella enoeca]
MKRVKFLSVILGSALLILAACSNDDNKTTDEGQVSATQAIEFKVDFADYNAEQEVGVTRANKEVKLEQQMVDLGNGILAQCTLQRDTTKQTKSAATRALANDTYTMLAYDAATHAYKGDITGTVTGGVFTATSANKDIILTPGTYDFVLFNSKVTRSGNNLTVARADAGAAMIGRTENVTITPTPQKQQVAFTLKHAGAKVKLKLTAYMAISGAGATLESLNATDIPASSTYDAATGTWTVDGGAALSTNAAFPASAEPQYTSETYTSTSGDIMFMPATDVSKLKLTFSAGNIYLLNMANKGLTFHPASTLTLEQNGAYVLNVKLMYNFLYLMSNGDVGTIKETIYGGAPAATAKTPIAVVLSRSNRMAVALNDAGGGAPMIWGNMGRVRTNTYNISAHDWSDNFFSHGKSGLDETWNASYSVGSYGVKATNPAFPASQAAANYNPGVAYTGSPALQWYLPSYTDFVPLATLGFGNIYYLTIGAAANWYGNLANVAFTQVNGTALSATSGDKYYWTSSGNWGWFVGGGSSFPIYGTISMRINKGGMEWSGSNTRNFYLYVRSFVKY